MKYRDAKNLHNGDQVVRKEDKTVYIVNSVEVFGQYKIVKINCLAEGTNTLTSLYNDEVE